MQAGDVQALIFTAFVWILVFGAILVYSLFHWRMSQREKGPKDFLKTLAHITLGWVKHWRLLISVPLIAVGLALIATSARYHVFTEITGYRYYPFVSYGNAVTYVGGSSTGLIIRASEVAEAIKTGRDIVKTLFIQAPVEFGRFVTDVSLIEFPVTTSVQVFYLEMGTVVLGLTVIVIGLILGIYHTVVKNNEFLLECGDHTAKFWANWYRMSGYEVDEDYERALATFYKTGKADEVRRLYESRDQ